ncbi:MAG TPA: hypothetical protein PK613_21940 [Anaerolineaceae bacterium]|nr:hypothetical protein [Anaerolineaceae bacterium]
MRWYDLELTVHLMREGLQARLLLAPSSTLFIMLIIIIMIIMFAVSPCMINYHKPKVVVFYGVTYQSYWQKISCTPFYYQESNKISTSDNGVPHFFSINHPAAMCSGNAYFENVGELISKVL